MTLRLRILTAFLIVFVCAVVLGAVEVFVVREMRGRLESTERNRQRLAQGEQLRAALGDLEVAWHEALLSGQKADRDAFTFTLERFRKRDEATKPLLTDDPVQFRRLGAITTGLEIWLRRVGRPALEARLAAGPAARDKGSRSKGELDSAVEGFETSAAGLRAFLDAQTDVTGVCLLLDAWRSFLELRCQDIPGVSPPGAARPSVLPALRRLEDHLVGDENGLARVAAMREVVKAWRVAAAKRRRVAASEGDSELLVSSTDAELGRRLRDRLDALVAGEQDRLAQALAAARSRAAIAADVVVIGTLLIGLIGLVVVALTIRLISRQIGGEPTDIAAITQQVADGRLEIEVLQDRDNLTGILEGVARMVDSLRDQAIENDQQNWLKTELNRILRSMQKIRDLHELCQHVVSELAPLVGAGHAAVFLTRNEDAGRRLALFGRYGLNERRGGCEHFEIGQGLVGQCAFERRPILLTRVPDNYIHISSGLGESLPLNILTLPCMLESEVLGVMEFASFQSFSKIQTELLNQVAANFGVLTTNIESARRTEELLAESRRLSEQSRKQADELQVANSELEARTEILRQNEEELQAQSEELQAANEELEATTRDLAQQKQELEVSREEIRKAMISVEDNARRLEQASRYKSEFLANMSHELRTPLNSLLVLSDLLADNREGNLTEDQIESARVIHSGGEDLLRLINDILDLSKVEAGKLSVHKEEMTFRSLVESLRRQMAPVAEGKGLALEFELDEGLPESFVTDRQRAKQILKNLLSNAVKFTASGSVCLRIQETPGEVNIRRDELRRRPRVSLAVTDTGIGIPEAKQREIFEAFTQADGSTSRRFGGTGLGLTISRELAHLLGGEVHVESRSGEGSTFTLILPLDDTPDELEERPAIERRPRTPRAQPSRTAPAQTNDAGEAPGPRRESADQRARTVLIIEDDHVFNMLLCRIATSRGFEAIGAKTGREGIRLARSRVPCAIVLDLGLPDMDGLEVLSELKNGEETRHIPVHISSGTDCAEDALAKGAFGFLLKPAKARDIEAVFNEVDAELNSGVKRLLIIEDDPGSQTAIRELFGSRALEISTAASGAEAMEVLGRERFDCVILDLELGDMTGQELLSKLGDVLDGELPPIVVYSGRELTREEHRELSRHARGFVVKGANSPDRLVDEVSLFLHSVEARLEPSQREALRRLHDPDETLRDRKILLVDDDLRNTFALSRALREHGLEVVLADNGELALEKLRTEAGVELVLMDIMMPVMDGYEAIRRLRLDPALHRLPVIALTAKAMLEDRARCLEAGADDYLTKPVDLQRLLSMMRVWLFQGTGVKA